MYARHLCHDYTSNEDVHSGWSGFFFPPDTLYENVNMFYPTPTKARTSMLTLHRFEMWTCMFPATSHLIQSIAHVNCQTYWRLTKQYTNSHNNIKMQVSYYIVNVDSQKGP